MTVHIEPASAALTEALQELFIESDCPCHCQWWHFSGDKNDWLAQCAEASRPNASALAKELGKEQRHSLVALEGDKAVGWLRFERALVLPKFYEQKGVRNLAVLQRQTEGVWTLACSLVHPDKRRSGVLRQLVTRAIEIAKREHGAAVEGIVRKSDEALRDDELWNLPHGVVSELGFEEVGRQGNYAVMRLRLR